MRYNQLIPIIEKSKPKTIVEVGTWNGHRAIMMATEALKHQKEVHYTGFDLFEDATAETDDKELNVKPHHAKSEVEKRLKAFQDENPGFKFSLIKGDTNKTLWSYDFPSIDLAFIDGGHSVETIKNDYDALQHAKVIVMDDFYVGRDTAQHGCNEIVKDLDHVVLPQKDPVKGGGKVQMVLLPKAAWPGKVNVKIKTQNCVPDEEIQSNITYALPRIQRWVAETKLHDETAIMVSAGPSFREHLDEIATEPGRIVCVKHAHDTLIESGIIPWGCMLLDPRSHVQDFIENPHPEVTYFVASMCHPTTIDRLLERGARVFGYHAHVGAGEESLLKDTILIGGGSTSAVRGISVLHTLGFRKFKLYGYDSCYPEKPDLSVKNKRGDPKYVSVKVSGRQFWSDAELIAQAQDFDVLMSAGRDMDLEVIGDGMIPHIWQLKRRVLPSLEDVMRG